MDDLKLGAGMPDLEFLPISCPKCGRKANSARCDLDPPAAVRANILCPDCVGGDFGDTTYFDAAGLELLPGPDRGYESK